MNTEDKHQHRLLVLNYIDNLFLRHEFFLKKIIECCSELKKVWNTPRNDDKNPINHYFDAYLNTYQSLKDSLEIAFNRKIDWVDFDEIPYSKFMKNCRNASTHDGFSIINLVVDGKFYISSDITRISHGKLVLIETPIEEISTVCLKFSQGLFLKIRGLFEVEGSSLPMYSIEDYLRSFNTGNIKIGMPEDVKQIINSHKDKMKEIIEENRENLIALKIKRREDSIESILSLCNEHLINVTATI